MVRFQKAVVAVQYELSSGTGALAYVRRSDRIKRVVAAVDQAKANGIDLDFEHGEPAVENVSAAYSDTTVAPHEYFDQTRCGCLGLIRLPLIRPCGQNHPPTDEII
jgi:hypothetical protein